MDFIQLLKETGRIPNKFESFKGHKGELFTHQKTNGEFCAMIVLVENELPKEVLGSAIGKTLDEAHDKLRDSILRAAGEKIKVSSHKPIQQGANSGQLQQHVVMGSVCQCGRSHDAMDIHLNICYECNKPIRQTAP